MRQDSSTSPHSLNVVRWRWAVGNRCTVQIKIIKWNNWDRCFPSKEMKYRHLEGISTTKAGKYPTRASTGEGIKKSSKKVAKTQNSSAGDGIEHFSSTLSHSSASFCIILRWNIGGIPSRCFYFLVIWENKMSKILAQRFTIDRNGIARVQHISSRRKCIFTQHQTLFLLKLLRWQRRSNVMRSFSVEVINFSPSQISSNVSRKNKEKRQTNLIVVSLEMDWKIFA